MNNKNKIYYIIAFCLLSVMTVQSCKEQFVETYSDERYLFFERYMRDDDNKNVRVDTVEFSFSHYVGKEIIDIPFTVKLVGDLLTEDTEYKVEVVKDQTTAKEGQYSFPDKLLFRKGIPTDTLWVKAYRDKLTKDEEVVLFMRIAENDIFKRGYTTYTDAKLRFNNKIVKPLWWSKVITDAIFGEYSYKKLETIVAANPDFTTIDDLSQTEIRKIAINTKEYILLNNILEENGTPMVILAY